MPRLIANHPGNTMGDVIGEELENADSFDMSVAFVSAEAVKSLFEDFKSSAERNGPPPRTISTLRPRSGICYDSSTSQALMCASGTEEPTVRRSRVRKASRSIPKAMCSLAIWRMEAPTTTCTSVAPT